MSDDQQQPPTTTPGAAKESDVRIASMSHGQPRCAECFGTNLVEVAGRGGQHLLRCLDCGTFNRLPSA